MPLAAAPTEESIPQMDERQIFHWLIILQLAAAVVTFFLLLFVTAPYGRHERKGWGPRLAAVPSWVIMEFPAVAVIALCFACGQSKGEIVPLVFLALWEIHYIHRTFVFPFLMRGSSRSWPIILLLLAIIFNIVNGYINGRWLFGFSPPYPLSWFKDPRFVIGTLLFLGGFVINVHSDSVLRRLRAPGESGYGIPQGGLFELVSGANYLGEIIEWTGWAIATWSIPGLAFAVFTTANLVPRAISHHRWYRRHFPDYPPHRKAIIPFLY